MRVVLTTALILMSGTALASSITPLTGHGGNGSVVNKACADCPPVKSDETSSYTVPVLETGPQKSEIIEINGEKKLIRTEAWLGGSPVVHVSKVQDWMTSEAPVPQMSAGSDGIDRDAMVGAVHAGMTGSATDQAVAFHPETMQLRLK
jgi:hypothetical protein